jgi:hypothetical protein
MITNAAFTLDETTATQIVEPSTVPQEVHLHNATKSSNEYVYIGRSTVSTTNGLHLDPGESKVLQLMPNDSIWALSDPDGLVVQVLTIRQN